jgi:hypothetical protein
MGGPSTGPPTASRGGCAPTVFIDGFRTWGGDLNSFVGPSDMEAVEIYRSWVPHEFGMHHCGALVIWTRRGS